MNVYEKLMNVQAELKAPKSQTNNFGKYNYRSCEDILEAVKPLLCKHKAVLTLSDEVVPMLNRIYVKTTATFVDAEDNTQKIVNTAYAREEEIKKGMDGSQITGASSSYARKYCLNGLFCIDDTKDADTDEYVAQPQPRPQARPPQPKPQLKSYVAKMTDGEVGLFQAGKESAGPVPLSKIPEEGLAQALNNPRYAEAKEAIQAEIEKRANDKIPF